MVQQPNYPWFTVVRGPELEQGDLLRSCPRFILPSDAGSKPDMLYSRGEVDAVILTQSCDLAIRADGECEATDVLRGLRWSRAARQGRMSFRRNNSPDGRCPT